MEDKEGLLKRIRFYEGDIDEEGQNLLLRTHSGSPWLAVDTETTGLDPHRDHLALIQVANAEGDILMVKRESLHDPFKPKNLMGVLNSKHHGLICHNALFDLPMLMVQAGLNKYMLDSVFCTQVASKMIRTYATSHSLASVLKEMVGVTLDKEQQTSFWGASIISTVQKLYAANDVAHLHALMATLEERSMRMGRSANVAIMMEAIPRLACMKAEGFDPIGLLTYGGSANGPRF